MGSEVPRSVAAPACVLRLARSWAVGPYPWETPSVGSAFGFGVWFGVRVVTVTPTEEKQADRAADNGS